MEITDSGQDIQVMGKSGETYSGKIYADKLISSTVDGRVIVCLTNSQEVNNAWEHRMNSIFNLNNATEAIAHFSTRDDITHLILLPHNSLTSSQADPVDDLVRQYLHG